MKDLQELVRHESLADGHVLFYVTVADAKAMLETITILRRYAGHKPWCSWGRPDECDCGWTQWKAKLEGKT